MWRHRAWNHKKRAFEGTILVHQLWCVEIRSVLRLCQSTHPGIDSITASVIHQDFTMVHIDVVLKSIDLVTECSKLVPNCVESAIDCVESAIDSVKSVVEKLDCI